MSAITTSASNTPSDNSARPFYFTVAALAALAVVVVIVFGPARLSRRADTAQ